MIKSTVGNEKPSIKYPILKINPSKTIVLFNSEKVGMVIHSDSRFYAVGHYRNNWDEPGFTDYLGSITIKNSER
jgi:hypothetical protein